MTDQADSADAKSSHRLPELADAWPEAATYAPRVPVVVPTDLVPIVNPDPRRGFVAGPPL